MENNPYKLSNIVSNSLGLAWKHKILWVFALLLLAGSSGNFPNGSNSIEELLGEEETTETTGTTGTPLEIIQEDIQNELDITFDLDYLNSNLNSLVALSEKIIPPAIDWNYVFSALIPNIMVGGFSIFGLMVAAFALALVIRAWAYGAMLQGVWNGIESDILFLKELGEAGLRYFKNMFKLFLWSFAFIFTPLLAVFIIVGLISLVSSEISTIFMVLTIFGYLIYLVVFTIVRKYADRFVVYENLTALEALKKGFVTAKKVFWKSFGLVFLNAIVGGVIGILGTIAAFIPILVIGIPFSLLVANTENVMPVLIPLIIVSIPVVLIFILGVAAVKGFVSTYKEFTWTFMYQSQKEAPNVQ